jgi:flagellar biosynthesis chaperone FliJ
MQNFRFRLARVFEWYTRQYQEEERIFSACLATLADARQAIVDLQAERLSIERDVLSRHSIPSRELVALGLYRLGARQRELELIAVRERCEQAVEAQRVKLQAAERRVRLLEKLRDRRLTEHNYAEARELEELASDAYFAKWAAR